MVTGTADTIATFGNSVSLDDKLKEASGVEVDANGRFWANNDHGNTNVLFGINGNGTIEKEIQLSGVLNEDWEDLAMDENDNLYIGDFGNNDNDRTDLVIFMIPEFSTQTSTIITPSVVIHFDFDDQTAFPPVTSQMHFDVEAFIVHAGMIYLFTKDRSDPFTGKTNMYQLPAEAGNHTATFITSFNTDTSKKAGKITSADLSPDGTKFILLSEEKLFLFTDFVTPDFFSGKLEKFEFPIKRKYEGVVFQNDCDLALVNEDKYGEAQQLLMMKICN